MAKKGRDYSAEYRARNERSKETYGVSYSVFRKVRENISKDTWAYWRDLYPDADDKLFWYN